jgi:hypothetical protein
MVSAWRRLRDRGVVQREAEGEGGCVGMLSPVVVFVYWTLSPKKFSFFIFIRCFPLFILLSIEKMK